MNNKNSDDYDEKYMKIKFNSDDKLPLNKTIEIPPTIIVLRPPFFMKIKKILATSFLDECLHIYTCICKLPLRYLFQRFCRHFWKKENVYITRAQNIFQLLLQY